MKWSFKNILQSAQTPGILLILCVAVSLGIANSPLSSAFQSVLEKPLGLTKIQLRYPVIVWINDGLMSLFFLLVGLEIKKEITGGALSGWKKASLPVIAAMGGMVIPALFFTLLNSGTPYLRGWAIPMATDIAFSLAVLSLLGKRVPAELRIFLAALAIADDLGAILVIALFYTSQIHWLFLGISVLIIVVLLILNKANVQNIACYLIPGVLLWYCLHHSGIHATMAGVILAFSIPTGRSETQQPLQKLEHALQMPVHFLIMPLFALANTNITLSTPFSDLLGSTLNLGIMSGLFLGKVLGITAFTALATLFKWAVLPKNVTWLQMLGVGFLAAIGFTMSIFIATLSFADVSIQNEAKTAILTASLLSGFTGYFLLRMCPAKKQSAH